MLVRPCVRLSIINGLDAHFHQTDGPSRPGTDWIVALNCGGVDQRLLVRTYRDRTMRRTPEQHAAAAIAYVSQLLEGGWSPHKGDEDGEIIVPDDFIVTSAPSSKPWWKFWA